MSGKIARGMNKDAFLRQYDDTSRAASQIRTAIAQMKKGTIYSEQEMRQMGACSVPQHWRRVAQDDKAFVNYWFETTDERFFWSDPETVMEMRKCSRVRQGGGR